jgi:hypothetical protein
MDKYIDRVVMIKVRKILMACFFCFFCITLIGFAVISMMPSASPVDPDHHSDFIGDVLSYILREDLVVSSQPSPFLQDNFNESGRKRAPFSCDRGAFV